MLVFCSPWRPPPGGSFMPPTYPKKEPPDNPLHTPTLPKPLFTPDNTTSPAFSRHYPHHRVKSPQCLANRVSTRDHLMRQRSHKSKRPTQRKESQHHGYDAKDLQAHGLLRVRRREPVLRNLRHLRPQYARAQLRRAGHDPRGRLGVLEGPQGRLAAQLPSALRPRHPEAWDFYRGFGDNADIPVLVLAAELGNSQSGRVANAIIGVALGVEQEQITLGIRPYDHPGSRTVNYNDVNDQMRKDLTEALADMVGEVVICRRNTRSGLLTYHGLISPNADGRRGVPRPNSLVMPHHRRGVRPERQELFNNVHYPAVEGDNAMPAAPQLPTVQFDIFKDIGPEAVERLMAAGKTDDGEGARSARPWERTAARPRMSWLTSSRAWASKPTPRGQRLAHANPPRSAPLVPGGGRLLWERVGVAPPV